MQPKKMLIVNILDILRKYSDEDHPLSQKDVAAFLERDYGMKVDRKAVKRNLMDLSELYNINYTEKPRQTKNRRTGASEENFVFSDFYMEREFTDGELRTMIDAVLFAPYIRASYADEIIRKLRATGNHYFNKTLSTLCNSSSLARTDTPDLFRVVERVNEALANQRKLRLSVGGREFVVSPYQLLVSLGRYYLVAGDDESGETCHFRLEDIAEAVPLPVRRKNPAHGEKPVPSRYLAAHPFMGEGPLTLARLTVKKTHKRALDDAFGQEYRVAGEDEQTLTVVVNACRDDLIRWTAMQLGAAEICEPASLRGAFRDTVRAMLHAHKDAE